MSEHWATLRPGLADQYASEARAVRYALGFVDAENVAPADLVEAINALAAQLATAQAAARLAVEALELALCGGDFVVRFEPAGVSADWKPETKAKLEAALAALKGVV